MVNIWNHQVMVENGWQVFNHCQALTEERMIWHRLCNQKGCQIHSKKRSLGGKLILTVGREHSWNAMHDVMRFGSWFGRLRCSKIYKKWLGFLNPNFNQWWKATLANGAVVAGASTCSCVALALCGVDSSWHLPGLLIPQRCEVEHLKRLHKYGCQCSYSWTA